MKCLRCADVELEVQARGEGTDIVEIDVCPSCQGVWLDNRELKKLDDNFFVDVEPVESEQVGATADDAQLTCPRCEGGPALNKVKPAQFGDVVVDNCPACQGFWLDKGELEKMRDISDRALIASLLDLDE
jgi:Zn-finger nucleic acid-binding protein